MQNSIVDFRLGDRYPRLVLLGACPGKKEFEAKRPFAGASGTNLAYLFEVLRKFASTSPEEFGLSENDLSSNCLDDYTLMNSHPEPKWKIKGKGRTTPTLFEVEMPGNLNRIRTQPKNAEATIVIALGSSSGSDTGPARVLRRLAQEFKHVTFLITGHPSPRAIHKHGATLVPQKDASAPRRAGCSALTTAIRGMW